MVYVDEVRTYPVEMIQPAARRHGRDWCHLTADSIDELHAFAYRLGLRRRYFQPRSRPHYDLVPARRWRAVALGAKQETSRERRRRERETKLAALAARSAPAPASEGVR